MGHTEELLLKIRQLILEGKISVGQIPIEEIKQCVLGELQLYKNTFIETQYEAVMQSMARLHNDMHEYENDLGKILMFLDAELVCINMISQAVLSLANGEYWAMRHQHELDNPEIAEMIDYVEKERKLELINYDFMKLYQTMPCEVFLDEVSGMKYIPYKGRKMFFPRGWEVGDIVSYYRGVIAEQNVQSPHCYEKEGFVVKEGDVVVDAGAAEGIFALDIIDVARKVYLIEADAGWVEALEQTFRDDTDKVKIVYKYLSSQSDEQNVTIDEINDIDKVNYIKMDIEGFEKDALLGATNTLTENDNIRCAICAYHCKEDEQWITEKLQSNGFVTDVSRGYICPNWTVAAYLEAELRRGVVFGRK